MNESEENFIVYQKFLASSKTICGGCSEKEKEILVINNLISNLN